VQDELNTCHRRSSHAGTSLDSSSIYALLSFDSSPQNGCTDCINSDADSLTTPVDRLKPIFGKDGVRAGDKIKYRHKKETGNETERTSVTSLVSAVPNHYIDSSSTVVGKKQLVVSLRDANVSKCTQSRTSENSSLRLSDEDETGSMSLPSAGDDGVLYASKETSFSNDAAAAEQCPEINHRRYSCGDQLAATWWRFFDRASSFSDLRVLPRSLSRLCCSTWRTFTGVKSPCIDVSKVGNVGPLQSCETSRLNVNAVTASVGDEIMEHSMSQWWHKSVSPDRRRLIDISSDVENSSVYEDSPRKVDCKRVSLGSAQNACETVTDSQLSDSDSGGSYVSLRVNCKSSACRKVLHTSLCDENVSHPCRTDCDIPDDNDTLFSVLELPTKHREERVLQQTGDMQELSSAAPIFNDGPPIPVSQSSSSTGSYAAVQPTHFGPPVLPCQGFTRSLSSHSCSPKPTDELLQSNNGYVNLSLGLQSCSLDRQSATFLSSSSSPSHAHPANVSTEAKSVPNLRNNSVVLLDNLAVHTPYSSRKERLSCDNSVSSEEPSMDKLLRKSSNRLLRLIRRSSTKARKELATCSSMVFECSTNHTESPAVGPTDSIAVSVSSSVAGNDEPPNVHRLPSPDVPPPPVPDDSATSRLFQLCHTPFSEHLPMNISADSVTLSQYEDLSLMKSCAAARKSANLSSSYSAGDRQHYDSQSLKSSANDEHSDNRLLARIPTHRHGWLVYVYDFPFHLCW